MLLDSGASVQRATWTGLTRSQSGDIDSFGDLEVTCTHAAATGHSGVVGECGEIVVPLRSAKVAFAVRLKGSTEVRRDATSIVMTHKFKVTGAPTFTAAVV